MPRLTYESWLAEVDAAVERLAGVSVHDLADYCYRDAYEDGIAPSVVAKRAIRADQGDD